MRRALREQPRLVAALISAEDNSEINWKNQPCFQILSDDRMGILSLGKCLFWLPPPDPPPRMLLVVGPHWIPSLVSCLPSHPGPVRLLSLQSAWCDLSQDNSIPRQYAEPVGVSPSACSPLPGQYCEMELKPPWGHGGFTICFCRLLQAKLPKCRASRR